MQEGVKKSLIKIIVAGKENPVNSPSFPSLKEILRLV